MHDSWVISLPERVSIAAIGRDGLTIESPYGRLDLKGFGAARRRALCCLAYPGRPLNDVLEVVKADGSPEVRERLLRDLQKLLRRGLLHFHVLVQERHLATLMPMSDRFEFGSTDLPAGRFVLSKFAYLRREFDVLLLESPLAAARVVVSDPRAAVLLHALSQPASIESLAASEVCGEAIEPLVRLLHSAKMLTSVDEHELTDEETQDSLKFWEFHDLLFHVRGRMGRHNHVVGGAYHWAGITDSPPSIKPVDAVDSIPLDRPNMNELEQSDAPFAQVIEQRCSVREYGSEPITARQLGEFLFRVARIRNVFEIDGDTHAGPVRMEFTTRPFPSAGGLYELEFYPLVRACSGLDSGLYYYDPQEHRLLPVAGSEPHCDQLFTQASAAAGVDPQQLQVLIIISARFPRMMWKYASMAYAAILKNVGVVYQTMYLTATSMKLAPCGLGCGDSDLFSKAIGSDYYEETSVGEFLLGSLPPGGVATWNSSEEDSDG